MELAGAGGATRKACSAELLDAAPAGRHGHASQSSETARRPPASDINNQPLNTPLQQHRPTAISSSVGISTSRRAPLPDCEGRASDGQTGYTAPHRPIAPRAGLSPNNARRRAGTSTPPEKKHRSQFFGKNRQLAQLRNLFLFHHKSPSAALPAAHCPGTASIR
jgi:hypothetical protein